MENPFVFSDSNKRYYTLDYYYRQKFGQKCFKVPLDGGFSCPNLDGTKGRGGCTYCGQKNRPYNILSLREQFDQKRVVLHRKWKNAGYIPYFNAYTGTWASADRLRELYDNALSYDGVVGLNIATRADAISYDTAALLHEFAKKTVLTIELGLQTVHDTTARRINRGHDFSEFLEGYEKISDLDICIHIINGLPGENKDMMLETARILAALRPHCVKIHLLLILRDTPLAFEYEQGSFSLLSPGEYTDIVVSQLELLPPDTVIARISGDAESGELIAPLWSRDKFIIMNNIDKEFVRRNSMQGKFCGK